MSEILKILAASGDACTIALVIYMIKIDRRILVLEIKNKIRIAR